MYHVHCQVVDFQEPSIERRNVVLNKLKSRSAGVEVKMPASFASCIFAYELQRGRQLSTITFE